VAGYGFGTALAKFECEWWEREWLVCHWPAIPRNRRGGCAGTRLLSAPTHFQPKYGRGMGRRGASVQLCQADALGFPSPHVCTDQNVHPRSRPLAMPLAAKVLAPTEVSSRSSLSAFAAVSSYGCGSPHSQRGGRLRLYSSGKAKS
jgi:hypothetical protein